MMIKRIVLNFTKIMFYYYIYNFEFFGHLMSDTRYHAYLHWDYILEAVKNESI